MPELPDVETFRRYLNRTSMHKMIEDTRITSRRILGKTPANKLKNALRGFAFCKSRRYGKYLFAETDGKYTLLMHFGMTGFLKYFKKIEPPKNTRFLIRFASGYNLAYVNQRLLGRIGLVESMDKVIQEKCLGPDAARVNQGEFIGILGNSGGCVKAALMNQKLIAGIGNIYADEILYQAHLHPKARANTLEGKKIKKIYKSLKKVIKTAVDRKADPEKMPSSWLLPYRNKTGKCPRCKNSIKRVKVSGRTSYYCPECQKSKNRRKEG